MTTKIINGKRYNTETAEEVADCYDVGLATGDFHAFDETLYRTQRGAWFILGNGGAMTSYAVSIGNTTSGRSGVIRAIPAADAYEWLEQHNETEALEHHFGDIIENA